MSCQNSTEGETLRDRCAGRNGSGLLADAAPQDRRGGGLLRGVRAPLAYPDHAGVHQLEAVEEAGHLVVRARDVLLLRREVGVKALLERGDILRQQVGARV